MDDRDFFDTLYQQWTKTTGAEDTFWMPEEQTTDDEGQSCQFWRVFAVDQEQNRTVVADFDNEVDADFVTAVHGCLGDLVKRLHDALDEADRRDQAADEAIADQADIYAELVAARQESQSHQDTIMHLKDALSMVQGESRQLIAERDEARTQRDTARAESTYLRDRYV